MRYFLILLLLPYLLLGQNIKGKVIDSETKIPVENVSVYFKNLSKGATTNRKGNFSLKTDSNNKISNSIVFSRIGYFSKSLTLPELKKNNFIINLSKKTEQLKKVTIHSNKKLKKEISFRKLSRLKKGIHSFGSVLVDDKIYVIGGDASYIEDTGKKAMVQIRDLPDASFSDLMRRITINPTWIGYKDDLQVYNITNDEWTKPSLNFRKRAYHNINSINDNLYVLGGKRVALNNKKEYLDETLEVYNLKTDSIFIDKTNPHQAVNFASFNFNNNIIVMGGSISQKKNGSKTFTNKSHIYNIDSGYWYELKNMTQPKEVKGVLIDNTIYLVGGYNGKALKEIEAYNITTGTWKKETDLFEAIAKPSLTHSGNVIYIFGDSKIMTYNTKTKVLNVYNIKLKLEAPKIHFYNDKLYIIGGYIEDEFSKTPSADVFIIDLFELEITQIIQSKTELVSN